MQVIFTDVIQETVYSVWVDPAQGPVFWMVRILGIMVLEQSTNG